MMFHQLISKTVGLWIFAAITLAVIGCSNSSLNPVLPDTAGDIQAGLRKSDSDRILWGVWEFEFDPSSMEITVTPSRTLAAHFNVVAVINPPACIDCITVSVNSFDQGTRILDVDVSLKNPTTITGRDVRGILYSNDAGHELRNPDAWTELYDIPGGGTLNPFKAFAKDEPMRKFAGSALHQENYLIYIPIPAQYAKITYAADVSWPGNAKEPYSIDNFTQETLLDIPGSESLVEVDVLDWQDDITSVKLSAPQINGIEFVDMSYKAGDTWSVMLTNSQGAIPGEYEVMVTATSTGIGVVDLHNKFNLSIIEAKDGWAATWGGISEDSGIALAADDFGNSFVTGSFSDTVDFDPGMGIDSHTSAGAKDAFLCKYDTYGQLLWARTWGGTDGDDVSNDVALDATGNVFVTGYYNGTADFDPTDGLDEQTSIGMRDCFLSMFNQNGNFIWARTWGETEEDFGSAVIALDSGITFVTGSFRGDVDFDPLPGDDKHAAIGNEDVFISRFTILGELDTVWTFGGFGRDEAFGMDTDNAGFLYIAGAFSSDVDFDPDAGIDLHSAEGLTDAFVAKFDQDGLFQWAQTFGAIGTDEAKAVAVDGSGNSYVTGEFQFTTDFDPGPGTDEYLSAGGSDAFLTSFDPSGTYQWSRAWGEGNDDSCNGVAVYDSGGIYTTGKVHGVVDLDPGPGLAESTGVGLWDIFITKFDLSGNFLWTRSYGSQFSDAGDDVAANIFGDIWATGYHDGTIDFNPGLEVENHGTNGVSDAYLLKFTPDGNW